MRFVYIQLLKHEYRFDNDTTYNDKSFLKPLKIATSCACKEGGGFGKSCAFLSFNILSITRKKIRFRKSLVLSD